jgi:hypothetical protein
LNRWALLNGIFYCIGVSVILAFIIAFSSLFKGGYNSTVQSFIETFLIWLILGGLISALCTIFIGIPIVIILQKFNFDTILNITIIGGLVGFIFGAVKPLLYGSDLNIGLLIMSIIYGLVCSFFFMLGYKREVKIAD